MAMQPSCPAYTVRGMLDGSEDKLRIALDRVGDARTRHISGMMRDRMRGDVVAALDAVGYADELLRRLVATIDEEGIL